ncbi:MAG TPA: hypothetical protein VHQ93_12655 [Chitinophagaceae bacterium]|jgi:hypothetical protein|nr:hypothetical protein [Chitinophagaceae bacterium]
MKLFSIFNKDKSRTLEVGNGMYTIKIPNKYLWEYENEDTLSFYPVGEETITIRVNVLNFEQKDGKTNDFLNTVVEEAESKMPTHEFLDDGSVLIENPSEMHTEDDTNITVQSWYVAKNISLIVFTVTTIQIHASSSSVVEMKNHLKQIFRSVTNHNNNKK